MNETELERLVVRLTGDMSGYVDALKQAQQATQHGADEIKNSLHRIEESLSGLKETAIGALEVFGAKKFLENAMEQWESQERAIIETEAALKANGRQVAELSADYQNWSSEMQKVTTIADEVSLSMLAQAETLQVTGDAAKAAVGDAIALAKGNADLAQSYLRVTAAMAAGDVERAQMFSRLIPQLRGVKDEAEFMERYTRSVIAGDEATREFAKTAGGRLQQLKNDWGDFNEELGKTVAEGVKGVAGVLKDLVHWMQALNPQTKESIVNIIALAAGIKGLSIVAPMAATALKSLAFNPLFWAVAATAALAALISEMQHSAEEAKKLKEELEATEKAGKLLREAISESASKDIGKLDLEGLEKRRKMLEDNLKLQEESVKRAEEMQAKELAGLVGANPNEIGGQTTGRAMSWIARQAGVTLDSLERVKKELEDEKNTSEAWKRAIEQVDAAIRRLKDNARLPQDNIMATMFRDVALMMAGGQMSFADVIKKQIEDFKQATKAAGEELVKSGQALTEKMKTPAEKYSDEVKKLIQLLFVGAITQETFNRAMREAELQLNKTADAQKKLNAEADAAGYGTSEASRRIEQSMLAMGGSRSGGMGVPAQQGPAPREFAMGQPDIFGNRAPLPVQQDKIVPILADILQAILTGRVLRVQPAQVGGAT